MQSVLQAHILFIADEAIGAVQSACGGADAGRTYEEAFVMAVLSVHDKFRAMVSDVFDNHPAFVALLAQCTRQFLKGAAGGRATSLLARYTASLLERSSSSASPSAAPAATDGRPLFSAASSSASPSSPPWSRAHDPASPSPSSAGCRMPADAEEREAKLRRVVRVLPHLDGADRFVAEYRGLLAWRLLRRTTVSLDLEAAALTLLRPITSFELAAKLHRMLVDARLSATIDADFAEAPPDGPAQCEVCCLVMTLGAWPLPTAAQASAGSLAAALPAQIGALVRRFEAVYLAGHASQKLSWCHHLSRVEVATTYLASQVTLQVTVPQLALLHFVSCNVPLPPSSLLALGLPPDLLDATLSRFLAIGILRTSAAAADSSAAAASSSTSSAAASECRDRKSVV